MLHRYPARRATVALAIAATLTLTLLALSGCSYFTADTPAAPDPAQTVSAEAKVSGTLDPAHPAGLPVWDGAEVASSENLDGSVYELTMVTSNTYDEVVYGVGKGLEDAGFTVETLQESDESTIIMALSDDLSAVYTITTNGPTTPTSIAVSVDLTIAGGTK